MGKNIPLRQCVGCREKKPKKEMVRVIKTPDNIICIDKTGKMNGRGAYICMSGECLAKAVKSKGLERSLKAEISEDIYNNLSRELITDESK